MEMDIKKLKELYEKNGGTWGEVNIFGIRNEENAEADTFNDFIGIATEQVIHLFPGTTDPGIKWTQNPVTVEGVTGAAHLCLGYHKNIWMVGTHGSGAFAHEALVQWGNVVAVWRDVNKNYQKDEGEPIQTGWYGINCHRAAAGGVAQTIGLYSAGCQVVQRIEDFKVFMEIIKGSEKYKKNPKAPFSYMLFDGEAV